MRRVGFTVFIVLLLAPVLAWLMGARPVMPENRAVLGWPSPTVATLASGRFFTDLDAALVQRLPLRQLAVDTKRRLLVDLLGERRFEDVVLGQEETLFLRSTLRSWCGWSEPWNVARRANAGLLRRFANGPPWLWVSVPDKFSVLGDRLPPHYQPWRRCADQRRARFQAAMEESLGPVFIDLRPALMALGDGGGSAVYHEEDTHWTPTAALSLPRAVLGSLAPGLWSEGPLRMGDEKPTTSDLALQLGLDRRHEARPWVSDRPGVAVEAWIQLESADRRGVSMLRHQAEGPGLLVPGQTLLVHDSFLLPALAAMAPYFEKLVLVQWEDLDQARFERLLADSDRVVFQSVDRLVSERQRRKLSRWWPPAAGPDDGPPRK